jgi:hypothetical protein
MKKSYRSPEMKLLGSASELTAHQICIYDFFRRKHVCFGFQLPKHPGHGWGGGKDKLS